jgi:hypothetical protein
LRNQVVSYMIWLWWVTHLRRDLNLNLARFSCFTFILCSFEESCLLVSWCAGGRCGMTCSDDNRDSSRRLGAEDRRWLYKSGTRWSGDREVRWRYVCSALCTWRRVACVSWLNPKTKVDGLSVVWSQNHWDDFSRFDLKTVAGFLVEPQNQVGEGFLGLGIKTDRYGLVIWA